MRNVYTATVKTAFIKAATAARAQGKSWGVALKAAKKAGYRGGFQGIAVIIRKGTGVKRGRKPGKAGVSSIDEMVDTWVRERVGETLEKVVEVLKAARG
jgi:hypothetical protein